MGVLWRLVTPIGQAVQYFVDSLTRRREVLAELQRISSHVEVMNSEAGDARDFMQLLALRMGTFQEAVGRIEGKLDIISNIVVARVTEESNG